MPKGIRGFIKGHKHSEETKRKIGRANSYRVAFNCDYCGREATEKPSHFARKKRHFCSQRCYSEFRKNAMPKEEHARFGSGMPQAERTKRIKARATLNHYLRDKKIGRPACEICGQKAEAHHDDYDKPLDVKWLCFKHHRLYHKIGNKIYENPELITPVK